MSVKADQNKVKKALVAVPTIFAVFYLCISAFLAWIAFQLAFVSSKNNYSGYILFLMLFAGLVWYYKVFVEHYKIYKILSNSTILFSKRSLTFSNPHGKIELQYNEIKMITLNKSHDIVEIYAADHSAVNVPDSIKNMLPGNIPFHEQPFLILRDIYEQKLPEILSTVPELKEKLKNYDDMPWLRTIGTS